MRPFEPLRRDVLRRVVAASVIGIVDGGCRRGAPTFACSEIEGLSAENLAFRRASEYVDTSPSPHETCFGCDEFVPAGAMPWGRRWPPAQSDAAAERRYLLACGRCKVVMGPIHPNGHCRLFHPKH